MLRYIYFLNLKLELIGIFITVSLKILRNGVQMQIKNVKLISVFLLDPPGLRLPHSPT